MKRFQIILTYKDCLPKTMNTLFRSERRARLVLTQLRAVCKAIAFCTLTLENGELILQEVEEFAGFIS